MKRKTSVAGELFDLTMRGVFLFLGLVLVLSLGFKWTWGWAE